MRLSSFIEYRYLEGIADGVIADYRDSAHCRIITLLGENLNPSDYCSGKGLRSTEDENLRLFKPFKQTRDLAPTPYAQLYRVQCTAHSETQPILHRLLFLLR